MKTIKTILKGMLLYMTAFITMIFIADIDNIMDMGIPTFLACLLVVTIMCIMSYTWLTTRDIIKLSGYQYFDKLCK